MSQYPSEPDQDVFTEPPVTVVVTERDREADLHSAAEPLYSAGSAPTSEQPVMEEDRTAQVRDSAVAAGQHVADVAKEEAGGVAAEAKSQAKDLLGQGRDELSQQAALQQDRVAGGLRSLAHELSSMAGGSAEQGLAADLAREAADRTQSIASWLESREPGQLLDEVRSFARERPGAFLGIAAAAGVIVGRLGRGLKEGEPVRTPEPAHRMTDPDDRRPGSQL